MVLKYTETRYVSRGGFTIVRTTSTPDNSWQGWYERGCYGTHWGYVEIYRQEDYTQIYYSLFGVCYSRSFAKSLTDASLKRQCTALASYAYARIMKDLE